MLAEFTGAVLVVVLLAVTTWKVARKAIDVEHQVSRTHDALSTVNKKVGRG